MKSITFTCETITPMFLSGVDGQTPELRPPSIKGALRFWWRAMNGHLVIKNQEGELDYSILKKTEVDIFGGTGGFKIYNTKVEAKRSKFFLRVTNSQETISSSKRDFKGKGLEYLFYLYTNQKNNAPNQHQEAYLSPTEFDITLSSFDEEVLLKMSACLWLTTYLGGIGSRARRGGGNFTIKKFYDPGNIIDKKLLIIPEGNLDKFLKKGIEQTSSIIKESIKDYTNICGYFSTVHPNNVYVSSRYFKSWQDSLNDIGSKMKRHRSGPRNDGSKFTQRTLDQKAAFGLPISVRNENPNIVQFDKNEDYNHRSSPLVISTSKISNNYYWVVTHLQGEFMPPDSKIGFSPRTRGLLNQSWESENPQLLNEFIDLIMEVSSPI